MKGALFAIAGAILIHAAYTGNAGNTYKSITLGCGIAIMAYGLVTENKK